MNVTIRMITTYTNIPIDPELIIGDVEKHVTGHNVTTLFTSLNDPAG